MINWFGPAAWDASVCAVAPRCDVPIGVVCDRCQAPILETDEGVTLPGRRGPVAFHLHCHLKMILPHTRWPSIGLVPDHADGSDAAGSFECRHCGMVYTAGVGWMRRLW